MVRTGVISDGEELLTDVGARPPEDRSSRDVGVLNRP